MEVAKDLSKSEMPPFYRIVSENHSDAQHLVYEIAISPEHPVFAGHFPGMPIVPGVMTMDIIKELVQKHLNQKLMLSSAKDIKFMTLIKPAENQILTFSIACMPIATDYEVNVSVTEGEQICLKMKGIFTPKHQN